MKYAIVNRAKSGNLYLRGFTNTKIDPTTELPCTYTVELREMSTLSTLLTGDAEVYLS